jgi:hypothetical protein
MLNGQFFFDESFGVGAPDPAEFSELERGNVAPGEKVPDIGAAAPQEIREFVRRKDLFSMLYIQLDARFRPP